MKRDIFDILFETRFLSRYKAYKQQLLYVFFGGITTIVNITTFFISHDVAGIHELTANIIAWIITMMVVYITNRVWVFSSNAKGFKEILIEILAFLGGRLLTLILDEIILYIFITKLAFPSMVVKIIAQFIVIVINYFISDIIVFRHRKYNLKK